MLKSDNGKKSLTILLNTIKSNQTTNAISASVSRYCKRSFCLFIRVWLLSDKFENIVFVQLDD